MSVEIENTEMLTEIFKKHISKVLRNISEKVYNELKRNMKGVYSSNDSLYYDRTYNFLNSIIKPKIKTTKKGVSVVIGIDYTKIKPKISDNGTLNAHADINANSIWNGISISEALLTWLDEGTTKSHIHNKNQSNYWYDVMGGRGYDTDVEVDYKRLDRLIEDEIKTSFSDIGIVIKKTTN